MTTYEHGSRAAPAVSARAERKPKKYDIRIVDHFYGYCQAVARTHRHRDEAQVQSQLATRRHIATAVCAGVLLCYYLIERFPQLAGWL